MNLGTTLKEARKSQNLTQEAVANKLYVSRQTVSRWEQNRTLPNVSALQELSDLYNISINELLTQIKGENNMKNQPKKHLNIFALAGVIIFNIWIVLAFTIVGICILGTAWFLSIVFSISPVLLIIVTLLGLQSFTFMQLGLSLLLATVGVVAFFILKKVTLLLFKFSKNYLKFNLKTIYY